jgi:hypothetical protein
MSEPEPIGPLGELVAAIQRRDPGLAAARRGYAAFLRGELSLDHQARLGTFSTEPALWRT